MTRDSLASISRQFGRGSLAASIVCLGLFGYCAYSNYSFWASAQQLPGTVTNVTRLPIDDQRGTPGYRMTVAFTDAGGQAHVLPMSGLYRSAAGDVGRSLTVYYNPDHPVRAALSSGWNYVGPAVYGGMAVGLLLFGWGALTAARNWTPPLQIASI
jgi:hypothetical protein